MTFRILLFFCTCLIIMQWQGCTGSHNNPGSQSQNDSINPMSDMDADDTVMNIIFNGKPMKIKVPKYDAQDYLTIQKLSARFKSGKPDSVVTRFADVTGDGIAEKIVGHEYIMNDSVYFIRTIYQNEKIIYSKILKDCLNDTVDEESLPGISPEMNAFEPYASFEEFVKSVDFCKDTAMHISNIINDSGIVDESFEEVLNYNHLPKAEYQKALKEFRQYIENFKGAVFISYALDGDGEYETWYEPQKRFISIDPEG